MAYLTVPPQFCPVFLSPIMAAVLSGGSIGDSSGRGLLGPQNPNDGDDRIAEYGPVLRSSQNWIGSKLEPYA